MRLAADTDLMHQTNCVRKRIAFLHRYGPADHIIAGGHCIPRLIEKLQPHCEIHYFGLRTATALHPAVAKHTAIHYLPYTLKRSSTVSKVAGTMIWYLALPFIALRCRCMGVDAIFMDETLPLTALIARVFFGRAVAITVADFFMNIYFDKFPWLRPMTRLIESVDWWTWRRLPLIFTKVRYTKTFLEQRGVPREHICAVYNPCDSTVYFPGQRDTARRSLSLAPDTLVIVHHGVLHPNKGNDRIIRALADIRDQLPDWRFLLIGSGPELNRLKILAHDLGISNRVVFTGWLKSESDVNMALNAADIGLVMRIGQYSDDFHMTDTLVHEMACGLPILAARLHGISEVVQEEDSGLLFDPDNMTEFKAKVKRLAADSALRQRLGRRAYDIACVEFDVLHAAEAMAHPLLTLTGIRDEDRAKS